MLRAAAPSNQIFNPTASISLMLALMILLRKDLAKEELTVVLACANLGGVKPK